MPTIFLKDAWTFAINQYETIDCDKASQVYDELISLYVTPNRVYHTISHVENMINTICELLNIYTLDNINITKAELILASFFHDVIYDPQQHDTIISEEIKSDEILSANTAIKSLKFIGMEEATSLKRIYELISLTDNHKVADQSYCEPIMQEIFFDADTSIFGAIKPKYDNYKTGIWKEYQHINPDRFIAGRIEFLTQMIEKKAIFNTEYMNQMYHEQAFTNLSTELKELDKMNVEELIRTIEG